MLNARSAGVPLLAGDRVASRLEEHCLLAAVGNPLSASSVFGLATVLGELQAVAHEVGALLAWCVAGNRQSLDCSSLPAVAVDASDGRSISSHSTSHPPSRIAARVMASGEDMSTTLSRLVGGLINVILGALILWVGQTTFRHAGILAGVDEKLNGVNHKFEDVEKRQEGLKTWMTNVITEMKDASRAQFTAKDGDKLVSQVRQAEQFAADLERKFVERLNTLELKLATLDSQRQGSQEVAVLRAEVAQLRSDVTRAAVIAQEAQYQQTPERYARGAAPVFLPPVDTRR